jgi:hypothetical protein
MQDNEDKGTSTDEVQSTREYIKIPVRTRFSAHVQTGHGAHSASYTMVPGCFPRGKAARGVVLTTYPHLAPRLKKE